MRDAYADSSYIVRLLLFGDESEQIEAMHRRLGQPLLYFNALHALEVPNALRARTFSSMRESTRARQAALREEESALRKLHAGQQRGRFQAQAIDWEEVFSGAAELSRRHTVRLGLRSLDLLHVQLALFSPTKDFLTCDVRQAALAKAAGLRVTLAAG